MSYRPDGTLNEVAAAADRLRVALEDRDGDLSDLISVVTSHAYELVDTVDAYVQRKSTHAARIVAAMEDDQAR